MAKGIEWHANDEPHQNAEQQQPSAPSNDRLAEMPPPPYDKPDDIVLFLVNGTDTLIGVRQLIAVHSAVLLDIVQNTAPNRDGLFRLPEIVDVRLFAELLRYFVSGKLSTAGDVDELLAQLEYARRYDCEPMCRALVQCIDATLQPANVMLVYQALRFHVLAGQVTKQKRPLQEMTCDQANEALMYNVLQFIDENADVVLQMDEFFDASLTFTDLEAILSRETLITSEVVVYHCLARWSRNECNRQNIESTGECRRRVLGSMIYIPRFLLMTHAEFGFVCKRAELLSADECRMINDWFDGRTGSLSREQTAMMKRFRVERAKYARMPLHLSERSSPARYSRKMRKNERKLDDDGTNSWLYWFCGCCAFICD